MGAHLFAVPFENLSIHLGEPITLVTQSLVCTLATPSGRVTLSDRKLITTTGDDRTETTLQDDAEILDAYRTRFGIDIDRVPTVSSRRGET